MYVRPAMAFKTRRPEIGQSVGHERGRDLPDTTPSSTISKPVVRLRVLSAAFTVRAALLTALIRESRKPDGDVTRRGGVRVTATAGRLTPPLYAFSVLDDGRLLDDDGRRLLGNDLLDGDCRLQLCDLLHDGEGRRRPAFLEANLRDDILAAGERNTVRNRCRTAERARKADFSGGLRNLPDRGVDRRIETQGDRSAHPGAGNRSDGDLRRTG